MKYVRRSARDIQMAAGADLMFTIECTMRRGRASHGRFQPAPTESPKKVEDMIDDYVTNGMPPEPVINVIVPVTVIG
jgi:hypothetical protein